MARPRPWVPDGLWAKLKGQAQRVVVVDSVTGLVYPPIVAKGEGSEGPWQRLFERAQQAGLDLDALRGVTSDGALAHASRLGWHWRIRVKGCFVVYRRGRRRLRLSNLAVEAGHAHFWQHVRITDQRYGPVYLALAHLAENGERWLVVSDEPTSLATLDEYGLRFDIEENFLDDKSNGFQLESSWIRSADALTRLGLVLAATTLYLVAQGTEVVRQNKRREPGPKLKVVFVNYAKA